jgi:hypothetical protein
MALDGGPFPWLVEEDDDAVVMRIEEDWHDSELDEPLMVSASVIIFLCACVVNFFRLLRFR